MVIVIIFSFKYNTIEIFTLNHIINTNNNELNNIKMILQHNFIYNNYIKNFINIRNNRKKAYYFIFEYSEIV